MNRDKEACHCNNVTYGMIEDAIKAGANTFAEVQDITGAGKCCGKCKDFLVCLIRDIQEELVCVGDGPFGANQFGVQGNE